MQRMNENRLTESKPLGELFGDLATEMSNLVRKEVALAKVEITQKAQHVGKNIGFLIVGSAVVYAALLTIITAMIMLLTKVLPNWSATLLVGITVAIIGGLIISKALGALKKTDMTPQQTVETLKEDVAWAKQQIK